MTGKKNTPLFHIFVKGGSIGSVTPESINCGDRGPWDDIYDRFNV